MNTLEEAAQAIRIVESDDDYRYQQAVSIGGTSTRRLGAYGIVSDRWEALAQAAGIPGADWNDRAAQDYIARKKLQNSYERYGDWDVAAISFRFGDKAAAALSERGMTDPASIEAAGYKDIANYLRNIKKSTPMTDQSVSGSIGQPGTTQQKTNPTRRRADEIVRNQLVAMRNAGRKVDSGDDQEKQQGGDTGIPAATE